MQQLGHRVRQQCHLFCNWFAQLGNRGSMLAFRTRCLAPRCAAGVSGHCRHHPLPRDWNTDWHRTVHVYRDRSRRRGNLGSLSIGSHLFDAHRPRGVIESPACAGGTSLQRQLRVQHRWHHRADELGVWRDGVARLGNGDLFSSREYNDHLYSSRHTQRCRNINSNVYEHRWQCSRGVGDGLFACHVASV